MTDTITIDEDILEVAREQAEETGQTVGEVISKMARSGFFAGHPPVRYPEGFQPFPRRSDDRIITLEFVNRLRDELP